MKMKVFISWSGDASGEVAEALRDWLKMVIQAVEPWMSRRDIDAGARWSREIDDALGKSSYGIVCLTPDNQDSAWVNFEVGAIAKAVGGEDTRVCGYLIHMSPPDVKSGPLALFQHKIADKKGTREMLESINNQLGDAKLETGALDVLFESLWPELDKKLKAVKLSSGVHAKKREMPEMVSETLELVREIKRTIQNDEQTKLQRERMLDMLGRPWSPETVLSWSNTPLAKSILDGTREIADQPVVLGGQFRQPNPPAPRKPLPPTPPKKPLPPPPQKKPTKEEDD